MASRCRSFSKLAFSLLKSAVNKPAFKATPMSSLPFTRPSINLSRLFSQLGFSSNPQIRVKCGLPCRSWTASLAILFTGTFTFAVQTSQMGTIKPKSIVVSGLNLDHLLNLIRVGWGGLVFRCSMFRESRENRWIKFC